MTDRNPYAPPGAVVEITNRAEALSLGTVFTEALRFIVLHWPTVLGAWLIVWVPSALFMSYQDYFVIDEDDFRSSFRMANLFDSFIGIVASGAVVAAMHAYYQREPVRLGESLAASFTSWPRIWITRTLLTIGLLLGLVLLVAPGVYLGVRWALAVNVAVVEQRAAVSALRRSWELTKDCSLVVLLIGLIHWSAVLGGIVIWAIVLGVLELDHWLLDAILTVCFNGLHLFFLICLGCVYQSITTAAEATPGEPAPASDFS